MGFYEKRNTKNNSINVVQIVFSFLILLMMLRQIVLLVIGTNELASTLFELMFLCFIVYYLFNLFNESKISFIHLLSWILCGITVLIINDSLIIFFEDVIPFLFAILLFSIVYDNKKMIFYFEKIYRAYIIIVSLILIVGIFVANNYVNGELLYYTQNANQSGLLLLCYFINIYAIRFDIDKKEKLAKTFLDAILLALAFATYKTECRTALICIAVIMLFLLFFKTGKKAKKVMIYGIFVLSLILPYIITTVIELFGSDFVLFGETIKTGREAIWSNTTKEIWGNIFDTHIGIDVSTIGMAYYGEGLDAHNTFLEIAWRYSAVVFVLFAYFFYKLLKNLINYASERSMRIIFPILVAMIVHMTFESSLIVGAFDYTLLFLLPIMIYLKKYSITMDN